MFAVIFEVQPKPERWDDYLGLAKMLKPEIEKIDGFIDNERFASQRTKGRLLSLSTWRDEKSVIRWRTLAVHHSAQEKGRSEIFDDYHLRVGEIVTDSVAAPDRPFRGQRFDETETGTAKAVTIDEITPDEGAAAPDGEAVSAALGRGPSGAPGLVDREAFASIYTPGKLLLLASWTDAEAAARAPDINIPRARLRRRHVRVIRDYGMFDRREAPQFYPDRR